MKLFGIESRSILAIGGLALTMAPAAQAQETFPSHAITMVVTSAPGGGTDVAARLSASLAEQELGQKIIVENKAGAGGALAIQSMLAAKHDGYTISFVFNTPLTVQPHIASVSYKLDSYAPLVMTDATRSIFCVKKNFPANTGPELIKLMRERPDHYTYGVDGPAGMVHVAGQRIFSALGVNPRAIPFDGASQILTGFQGDYIDIYGGSIPPILGLHKAGDVKCLITANSKANPVLPEASSVTDLGIPQAETINWKGIIAPADTPPDRLDIIERAFQKAVTSQKYRDFAASQGGEAVAIGHVEFRKWIDREYVEFGEAVAKFGLNK